MISNEGCFYKIIVKIAISVEHFICGVSQPLKTNYRGFIEMNSW